MTSEATARADIAREYYRAIDADEYDALARLLAPEFTHYRPDRTLSGREAFVRFMRDDRPRTDTEHAVDAVYRGVPGVDAPEGVPEVAVRGRLLGGDGAELFGFVDVFRFAAGDAREDGEESGENGDSPIAELRTYTD